MTVGCLLRSVNLYPDTDRDKHKDETLGNNKIPGDVTNKEKSKSFTKERAVSNLFKICLVLQTPLSCWGARLDAAPSNGFAAILPKPLSL